MLAEIAIHHSQFPDQVRQDLLASLESRKVNHKFHYDSVKQTLHWLRLHQAYSPARTDPGCAAAYDESFRAVAGQLQSRAVHLIGLGCGGGQKDARLLRLLRDAGMELTYTPADVSSAMVLIASQAAQEVIGEGRCFPLVCDMATAEDLPEALGQRAPSGVPRLITFFGLLPNFEPGSILPRLSALARPEDTLLLSANLAPGPEYGAGVKAILPLYDNALTRDWLMIFLTDLGISPHDGALEFDIVQDAGTPALLRVEARFQFTRGCEIEVDSNRFVFPEGDSIRLFFSYRHTPALVRSLLSPYGLTVRQQWIAGSEEEGVFLASRAVPGANPNPTAG